MEAIPLTLYLRLPQGQYADLDVASRVSADFGSVVRLVAEYLETEVSIELISSSEGSLGVNTIARIKEAISQAGDAANLIGSGLKKNGFTGCSSMSHFDL